MYKELFVNCEVVLYLSNSVIPLWKFLLPVLFCVRNSKQKFAFTFEMADLKNMHSLLGSISKHISFLFLNHNTSSCRFQLPCLSTNLLVWSRITPHFLLWTLLCFILLRWFKMVRGTTVKWKPEQLLSFQMSPLLLVNFPLSGHWTNLAS